MTAVVFDRVGLKAGRSHPDWDSVRYGPDREDGEYLTVEPVAIDGFDNVKSNRGLGIVDITTKQKEKFSVIGTMPSVLAAFKRAAEAPGTTGHILADSPQESIGNLIKLIVHEELPVRTLARSRFGKNLERLETQSQIWRKDFNLG